MNLTVLKKLTPVLIILGILMAMSACFAPLDSNGRDNEDGTINISLSAIPLPSRAPGFSGDGVTTDDLDFTVTFTNTKTDKVVAATVTKGNDTISAKATITPGMWKISIEAKFSATVTPSTLAGETYALATETVNIQKSENITIQMKRAIKVIFDSNGGTPIDPQYVMEGGIIKKPVDPTKLLYLFEGWYEDTLCTISWDFSVPVSYTESLVTPYILYAKWEVSVPVITINTQPASINVIQGSISGSLITAASVDAAVSLGYQWYENTSADNSGGTAISGTTGTSFTIPATLTIGTYYYFCEISAAGAASVRTNIATVIVQAPGTPVISITTQPAATTEVLETKINGSLLVTASVTQSATLSYQWYSNTGANNSSGIEMPGKTGNILDLSTLSLEVGTNYYYFCEVSATGGATSLRSNAATITVIKYGTAGNPFTVNDATELGYVGKGTANPATYQAWTLTAHYIQTANITLSGNWERIGSGSGTNSFSGSYDGDGFTISNLTMNATAAYQGLFGYIGKGSVVKNLGLVDLNIQSSSNYIGGIAGRSEGKVENCYTTGSITTTYASASYAGGLVGENYSGTITGCVSMAAVKGVTHYVGGIAGTIGGSPIGTISNCVALNSSLTFTYAYSEYIGRVTGTAGTYSNNRAWDIMDIRYSTASGTVKAINSSLTNQEGLNITAEEAKTKAVWESAGFRFTDSATPGPWKWNASGMPSTDSKPWPLHLTTGIASSPFPVADEADLRRVGTNTSAGTNTANWTRVAYYKQTANITLSGNWTPIGIQTTGQQFYGNYDGNGFSINNLTINATTQYQGMFGYIGANGIVKNLALVNVNIQGSQSYIGAIAGYNTGRVENCYVTGIITSTYGGSANVYAGGLVGYNSGGTITGCFSMAAINAVSSSLGGIAGQNEGGTISNCVALNSSITTISGYTYMGRITNGSTSLSGNYGWDIMDLRYYTNSGRAKAITDSATGIDGKNITAEEAKTKTAWERAGFRFTDSATPGPWVWNASGMPSTDNKPWSPHLVTGIESNPFIIQNDADMRRVGTATQNWSLLAYYRLGNDISLTSNNFTAIGNNDKRFQGVFDGNGYTISNLTINATTQYQGMFGYIGASGVVKNLGLVGVNIQSSQLYLGAIAGRSEGRIENCYVTGSINSTYGGSANVYAGGLVGTNDGTISGCFITAAITSAGSNVGGIAGDNTSGRIENCIALNSSITTITSYTYLGRITYGGTSLSNNYAWSGMDIRSNINNGSGGTAKNITTTGVANGIDGLGITASEVKTQAAWETAGFYFNDSTPTTGPWVWSGTNMPRLNNSAAQNWPF